MIAFWSKWKSSSHFPLVSKQNCDYLHPFVLDSGISINQSDTISVDASNKSRLIQLVENKHNVWLLLFARRDVRSKKDKEARFLRKNGRAVNVVPIACSLFLKGNADASVKAKKLNLTITGIPSRNKILHSSSPKHQCVNLGKEYHWIINPAHVCQTIWNTWNLKCARLNAIHLLCRSLSKSEQKMMYIQFCIVLWIQTILPVCTRNDCHIPFIFVVRLHCHTHSRKKI